MDERLTYHFFGDFFIENPVLQELQMISPYLPLLNDFEGLLKTRVKKTWDCTPAFQRLIEQDTEAWRRLGADRLPHFVQPSGSISSPLAIHLLNPTFYVANPRSTMTDDPTNPTIRLLHDCGLTSKHCFMFDEISRRDRTDDCLLFYTKDLRRPHEAFTRVVRENMSAVVEICFGEEAFKGVSQSANLIRLPLWGTFKSVKLWLEVNDSNPISMKRFVIQAYHPQFFARPGRFKKFGTDFLETYARSQDLMILVATQLSGLGYRMQIQPNFFECHFIRGKYPRLSAQEDLERQELVRQALVAFRVAFPDKFEEYELRQARRNEENSLFQDVKRFISRSLVSMQAHCDLPITEQEQTSRLEMRDSILRSTVLSCPGINESVDPLSNEENNEDYAEIDHSTLPEIPSALWSWLQSQQGLMVHGVPIMNRERLELAFVLLDRGRTTCPIKNFSTEHLASMVGMSYITKITRIRSAFSLTKAVPGEPGSIVYLKCNGCQKPVLDDAFPWYTIDQPSTYVIEVARTTQSGGNGCGQEGCKGKPGLVPVSRAAQDHTRMEGRAISQTIRRKSNWKSPLCRTGNDLRECAGSVRVRCRGSGKGIHKVKCGLERDYNTPEWSLHSPPRLILPRLRCDCDGRTKDHYFEPVDKELPTMSSANLRKIQEGFSQVGCDLAAYPKLPGIIFDLEPNGKPRKNSRSYKRRFEELKRAKSLCG